MSLREHAWEGIVSLLSWIVAVVAIAFLGLFAVADAVKRRRAARAALTMSVGEAAAASLQMELAS